MEKEIERKFLIENIPDGLLDNIENKEINQYYINQEPEVRIRQSDDKFYLTMKKGEGLIREEFEVEIGQIKPEDMQKLNKFDCIKKTRYFIPYDKFIIELDIYKNIELMTAEVEFTNEKDVKSFIPPEWFNKELTGLPEFSNKNLAKLNHVKS